MDLNTAAIYFGISAVIAMFLFNIFHCALANVFGVRIEKFSLLTTFGNTYLIKFKRNHTQYNLGWIPTGSYIKISGMIDERFDTSEPLKIEDYMLLSKPPIVRIICTFCAPALLVVPFLISAFFIVSDGSINEGFQILIEVINNIYQYISGTIDSVQTETNWNTITNTANIFPIILCLLTLFMAISSTISAIISNIAIQTVNALMLLNVVFLLCYVYILYKLGALYFSKYDFTDGLIDFLKFLVPVYIFSLAIILLIKVLPKNKYI
ncbi:site-2 protease family protein [Kordia sp.]|uniref:site-2 protease family protein n=1 Tax=Kordia sp. TaxID=1965332 RepID=UPI003D6A28D6